MKNFKFLSALALTGMLSAGMAGIVFADGTTKMHGEYNGELRTLKTPAVAFSLADKNDALTVDEILSLGKYTSVKLNGSDADNSTVVKTGDYITTDGTSEKKDVVIYGDVDKNGAVEIEDVVYTSDLVSGKAKEATDVQKEAADVENNGTVEIEDVLRISDFVAGKSGIEAAINVPTPTQKEEKYQYTMTVNENNIINNVNQYDLDIEVSYDKEVAEDTNLKLVAFDATGRRLSISGLPADVKLPEETTDDNANKMEVKVENSKSAIDVSKDEKDQSDVIGGYQHIADGTIYFRLFDAEDTKYETSLGETKVVKNTVEPTVANVSAERTNTDNASVKATRYGESDLVTIYYCAVPDEVVKMAPNKDAVTWDAKTKKFSTSENQKYQDATYVPETRAISVNSDSIEETIEGLDNDNGYRVYYILENSYGSQTVTTGMTLPYVDVAKDSSTAKEEKITAVTLPKNAKGKFSWSSPHSQTTKENGYIVTLYKDGEIYYETADVSDERELDFINYKNPTAPLETGTYYIEVVTKGHIARQTGTPTVNSDKFTSETVTVKAINSVSGINLTVDETTGYPKLSWNEDDENCGGYTLELYNEDIETGVFRSQTLTTCTTKVNTNKSIYFSTAKTSTSYTYGDNWNVVGHEAATLNRNTGYYVAITANVDTEKVKEEIEDSEENTIYVDSQPEYYYFCAPYREAKITSASDRTMTFKLDEETKKVYPHNGATNPFGKEESDLTYAVRVYQKIDGEFKDVGTKEVETSYDRDEDGNITATYFTVSGLEAYTEYQFRLITKCGEFEGWSDVIVNGHTMPRIDGLTCGSQEEANKENSDKFYSNNEGGAKVIIEGKEFKAADFTDSNLQNEFTGLKSFLAKLKTGDVVTITGDIIDVVLNSNANEANDASFMYSVFLKGKVLNITGNGYERKIGKPTGSGTKDYPAEVNLISGQFDLTNFQMAEDEVVTLGDGVKIRTSPTGLDNLIVVAGAEVTVNNVKMKTDLQTVINTKTVDSNGVELTVVANGEESNNLVFENLNNSVDMTNNNGYVTIKFVSSNGTATTQQGSITIKGNGGKVTVTQENVTVGSDIDVTVEKGEVDVSAEGITGEKTVTLSAKSDDKVAKITAIVETSAPDLLKGKTLEIKDNYTKDTLKTALTTNTAVGPEITDEIAKNVNEWLSKFGVSAENVKVSVDSNGTKVTIENQGTSEVQIHGLK